MDEEFADAGIEAVDSREISADENSAAKNVEFTLFYSQERASLVGFLVVQGARPDVAAEIAHDAMTEAYRHWDIIDTPRSWVRTVAARAWWRQSPKERTEVPREDPPEPCAWLSPAASDEIENRHTFLPLLRGLPKAQREVMAWTYDGYRPTEIAVLLSKTPEAVRSALRDARLTLGRKYRPGEETG
jgi:DNA-directed RNA polymerase specialized sigma24 family protein